MNKIRIQEHARFAPDKMAKVALGSTERALVDLYCVAPGQSQKAHTHGDQDKVYVVLEGSVRITVGAEDDTFGPGEAIIARAGEVHGLANESQAPAVLLVVVTPPPPHAPQG